MDLDAALDQLDGAVEDLVAALVEDPDRRAVARVCRSRARLDAALLPALRALARAPRDTLAGHRDAAAWLASATGRRRGAARRDLARARALGSLPAVETAYRDGEIGPDAAATLARLYRPERAELLRRDEQLLVGLARTLSPADLERAAATWSHAADDEVGAPPDDGTSRRSARFWRREDGFLEASALLDPVAGTVLETAVARVADELFEQDWRAAREELGREPVVDELGRTFAQRRADALVELAVRASAEPDGARRPRPLLTVVIDHRRLRPLVCEVEGGPAIAPSRLHPYLAEAEFERVVFAPERRTEVSRRARLFAGATRRAIELRDGHCLHEGCDVPASRCQVDHVVPFAAGGETTEENGRLLCGFHNRVAASAAGLGGERVARRAGGREPP